MFIARIELKIRTTDRTPFRAWAAEEAKAARALDGCMHYSFAEDVADPTCVLLYEEWSTRAAFEAYKRSALFDEAGKKLVPLLAEPPKSAYYESENLFDACAVRTNP